MHWRTYNYFNGKNDQLGLTNYVYNKFNLIISNVVSFSCNINHIVAITKDGSLYACGHGFNTKLGCRGTFELVPIENVVSVNCGNDYTMAITKDGTLYACGYNGYGQLGLGGMHVQFMCFTFFKVEIDIASVSCGSYHTMIITKNRKLHACGFNTYGQLGLGCKRNKYKFKQVLIENVVLVSCGEGHTMALTKDGSLYSCGLNNSGQLGLGDYVSRSKFELVSMKNVVSIDCGEHHTIVKTKDGNFCTCGVSSKHLGLDSDYNNKFRLITIQL